ncbi:MAG: hypothetical protein ACK58Z_09660 [Pseudanabaena sp.]
MCKNFGVRGDRYLVWGNRRSGCMGDEGRSLFDEGIGDRVLWVGGRSVFDVGI